MPDPALYDSDLFGKLHLPMKDMPYADIPAIQKAYTNMFLTMPASDLKSSCKKFSSRLNYCIKSEGDYFE